MRDTSYIHVSPVTTMHIVTEQDVKGLYLPPSSSHKGQNGRVLIIGGSHLFHAASLWALKVASRIVDLVHYSSVAENNEIVQKAKEEFRDGIVVHRNDIESYIEEDDCILIGPGMNRVEGAEILNSKFEIRNLAELDSITNEGVQTAALTNYLLKKYPHKQWVIDAGALQMMDVNLIPQNAVLTPHQGEFETLWEKAANTQRFAFSDVDRLEDRVALFAKHYQCVVLVKGVVDMVCNGGESGGKICVPGECAEVHGGNSGMTKGGTGDVLAGLIAALAAKNDPFLAATAGSFINKKAGDSLSTRVGPYFNASDLVDEIPKVMKEIFSQRIC